MLNYATWYQEIFGRTYCLFSLARLLPLGMVVKNTWLGIESWVLTYPLLLTSCVTLLGLRHSVSSPAKCFNSGFYYYITGTFFFHKIEESLGNHIWGLKLLCVVSGKGSGTLKALRKTPFLLYFSVFHSVVNNCWTCTVNCKLSHGCQ